MHSDLISCENSLYVWYKTHLRETSVVLAIDMARSWSQVFRKYFAHSINRS